MSDATALRPLPAELTSFVGRRREIAGVRDLISTSRLVTLTGMGGVGKSRLARRIAGEVRRAFPDGVCYVQLAPLTDASLLPQALLDALAIRDSSTRPPLDVLVEHLRHRRLLLVLDNCEHLAGDVAGLVDPILRAAPEVRIVATSRHALRIEGEYIHPVPPLPVPAAEDPLVAGSALEYPSVALLVERAAAVVPGFALTAENEPAVLSLSRQLEGIPLAIELASVALRVLGVEDLAGRLDQRFELLRGGARNLPERHRTLQALVDWSYDLCTPRERLLWSRASVFAGSFDTDDLEAVCADEEGADSGLPRSTVLATASELLDKSIFVRESSGRSVRFRMLETLRAYGQARLEASGEFESQARRHRDWYLTLMAQAETEWTGGRQQEWVSRLQAEHANLRRALEYCLTHPDEAHCGLGLAAVPWFWDATGRLREGRLWLERTLDVDREPSHERAWALTTAAHITVFLSEPAAVPALLDEALQVATELDDVAARAYATHVRGIHATLGTDPRKAIPYFTSAMELYAQTDINQVYPDTLRIEMASAFIMTGDLDQASAMLDELYDQCKANADRWQMSYVLWGRGFIALKRKRPADAEPHLTESLRISAAYRDTLGMALAIDLLAWAAIALGDAERGAALLGGSGVLWADIGSRHLGEHSAPYLAMARSALGSDRFDTLVRRGGERPVEETVASALRDGPPAAPSADSPSAALTARQREVAELVAQGMSNKEIAAKLVISLRTAEGHVETILTRLGFTSRTQIASWVAQQATNQPSGAR